MPAVLDEYDYRFELGKAAELRTGRDVVIISTGLMTMRALQAAARLEADHVDVGVLHVPTIKPLDRDAILRAAAPGRLVVTCENHTVVGGLAESVAAHARLRGRRPPASCRSPCPTSSSPRAPCPPCTTATACPPTPSSPASSPSSRSNHADRAHTAIVTGAGSKRGIGRATAHALAAAGWNVAVLDLDEAGAKDVADEIAEQHGVQAVGVACDVTDEASVEAALAVVDGAVPPVGALVNNAGITSPTRFLDVTDAEWDRIFAVNVRGAYNITRRVAPGLAERGFGRIVFLSSVSAERGGGVFGGVAYSAAKAAQLGFARALARELGPHGVTVNSVAPGLIGTDITGGALEGERKDAAPRGHARSGASARSPTSPTSSPTSAARSPATSPGSPTTSTVGPTSTESRLRRGHGIAGRKSPTGDSSYHLCPTIEEAR